MTEPVTTDTATTAKSGVDVARFASRRALVLAPIPAQQARRGVAVLLVVLFIGCYALPSVLPYSYTDSISTALQQPPSLDHWFGTTSLGPRPAGPNPARHAEIHADRGLRGVHLLDPRCDRRIDRRLLRRAGATAR